MEYWSRKPKVLVRGGGDLATGTIYKLVKSGFQVLVCEIAKPSAIRTTVAFSTAMYSGKYTVEDVTCFYAADRQEAQKLLEEGKLVMIEDTNAQSIEWFHPDIVVDAILAKKNLGTSMDMAGRVIALGPGFEAGKDAHFVIETKRGHNLGRIIEQGTAAPNTGIPGVIGGYGKERVMHTPAAGIWKPAVKIGDAVEAGALIGTVTDPSCVKEDAGVHTSIAGLVRGVLPDGYPVTAGFKAADVDPRLEQIQNCTTISDKARCIAGGVLEACLRP